MSGANHRFFTQHLFSSEHIRIAFLSRDRAISSGLFVRMRSIWMVDLMMVAIALGFSLVALGYVVACDRM